MWVHVLYLCQVCDEYSKGSAVFKMLTQTNIAIPLEQFFEAGAGNPSLQDSAPPLIDAASAFVTEERMGAQYAQSRADFKGSVLSLGVLTSLGQAGVVLGANSAAAGPTRRPPSPPWPAASTSARSSWSSRDLWGRRRRRPQGLRRSACGWSAEPCGPPGPSGRAGR